MMAKRIHILICLYLTVNIWNWKSTNYYQPQDGIAHYIEFNPAAINLRFCLLEPSCLELIISDLLRGFWNLQSNEEDLELISLLLIILEALCSGWTQSFCFNLNPYSRFQYNFITYYTFWDSYYLVIIKIDCSSF
ncbi:unnamed protein product [Paramecium octaurelia]|uniref:Uncharacterized protein n=1 Tax=Paramecium octaurelia TaxID=43137 RepID=A0A8S1TRI9_PAROT|nr:unnamed protein product [Paramecium octaurelia]